MVRMITSAYSTLTRQSVGTDVLVDFLAEKYQGNLDRDMLMDSLSKKYNREVAEAVCKKVIGGTEIEDLPFDEGTVDERSPFIRAWEQAKPSARDHVEKMVDMYYDPEEDPEDISVEELFSRCKEDEQEEYIKYLLDRPQVANMHQIFENAYYTAKRNGESYEDGVLDTILQLIEEGYLDASDWELQEE